MLLISRPDIGEAAWSRAVRTGVILPLTRDHAVPADVSASIGVRALAIAPAVPIRCAVTGLSALWLLGFVAGECPLPFRVVVPRGRHPDPPPGWASRQWQWHTDGAHFEAAQPVADILAVRTADAVATALRLDDHRGVVPAVAAAIRAGGCALAEVEAAIARGGARSPGRERQLSAWRELKAVILAAGAARP